MKKLPSLLLVVAVAGVGSADAQPVGEISCMTGVIRTCASFDIQYIAGGGITIRVQNLQGWADPVDGWNLNQDVDGSLITNVGLMTDVDLGEVTFKGADFYGGEWTGDPTLIDDAKAEWGLQVKTKGKGGTPTPAKIGGQDVAFNIGIADVIGGIAGCGDPHADPAIHNVFRTCDTTLGGPGYVMFSFGTGLTENPMFEAAQIAWGVRSVSSTNPLYDGESFQCVPGSDDHPCDIVPEPVTMVLLGTGLVGVGGAALRRRRRGMDVSDE